LVTWSPVESPIISVSVVQQQSHIYSFVPSFDSPFRPSEYYDLASIINEVLDFADEWGWSVDASYISELVNYDVDLYDFVNDYLGDHYDTVLISGHNAIEFCGAALKSNRAAIVACRKNNVWMPSWQVRNITLHEIGHIVCLDDCDEDCIMNPKRVRSLDFKHNPKFDPSHHPEWGEATLKLGRSVKIEKCRRCGYRLMSKKYIEVCPICGTTNFSDEIHIDTFEDWIVVRG